MRGVDKDNALVDPMAYYAERAAFVYKDVRLLFEFLDLPDIQKSAVIAAVELALQEEMQEKKAILDYNEGLLGGE